MPLIMEDDIIDIYCRSSTLHGLMTILSKQPAMDALRGYGPKAQLAIYCTDRQFYPLSVETPRKILPSPIGHTKGVLPFIRVGFEVEVEGFDTLAQVIVWWDVCRTQ